MMKIARAANPAMAAGAVFRGNGRAATISPDFSSGWLVGGLQRSVPPDFLELEDGKPHLTAKGKDAAGEYRHSKYGGYFLWPDTLKV
jgi:hypothetical protein